MNGAKDNNQYKQLSKSKHIPLCLLITAVCTLLSACSSKPSGRYAMEQDTAPNFDYGQIQYREVTPVFEPYNVWTARPYKVLGKYYSPMLSAKGYEEVGQASWYGQKFHGHKTATGEVFDMFALTAAHKTLPLPSFVKVTNLKNNNSVTVRVNDRGPFHGNRLIDLSYGAAKKLGFHEYGVADVKIEVIHISENGDLTVGNQPTKYAEPDSSNTAPQIALQKAPAIMQAEAFKQVESSDFSQTQSISPTQGAGLQTSSLFVQVMAMENAEKAKDLATGLANLLQVQTHLPKTENIYRLQLGPIQTEQKAESLIKELGKLGFDKAFAIQVSLP